MKTKTIRTVITAVLVTTASAMLPSFADSGVANMSVSSLSYVQEGIVAQWDGIENAGRGSHDSSATSWADLSGNGHNFGNFTAGVTWTDNAFVYPDDPHQVCASVNNTTPISGSDYASWDLSYTEASPRHSPYPFVFGFSGEWKGFALCPGYGGVMTHNHTSDAHIWSLPEASQTWNEMHTVFADYGSLPSTVASACYFDGLPLSTMSKSDGWGTLNHGLGYVGGGANNKYYSYRGRLHALRLYSRSLTLPEVQLNRAIDLVRFGGKPTSEVDLPSGYSWTDTGTGVILENAISFAVSSIVSDCGTVSADGETSAPSGSLTTGVNTSVTLRAIPAEGFAFYCWTGDTTAIVGGSDASAEISVATARPVLLTARFVPVLSSLSYVQEGIVAQWDGIENAGRGSHDSSATSWADLSGNGHNLGNFNEGVTWTDNAFVYPDAAHQLCAAVNNENSTPIFSEDYASWDLAYTETSRSNNYPFFFGFKGSGWKGLCLYPSATAVMTHGSYVWKLPSSVSLTQDEMHTVFADYGLNASMKCTNCIFDGVSLSVQYLNDNWGAEDHGGLGYFKKNNYSYHGKLHTLRLYSRSLTLPEVQLNRAIDLVRFGGKTTSEVTLPSGYSWTDTGTGVILENAISFAVSGIVSECGTVSADGATSAPSGSLTTGVNTSVTLRAIPAEGFAFHCWTGDTTAIVGGSDTSAEISVATARPVLLTARFCWLGGILDEDKNYVGMGEGTFKNGATVDLNGQKLYIDPVASEGVTFIDSSSDEKGELHIVVPSGDDAGFDTLDASGNLKVVKDGAGSLAIPTSDVELKCAEGLVSVSGALPAHRWSFTNGSLEDSIGGKTAVFSGSGTPTYANNEVKLPGGSIGTSCLDLGNNVFPSSGPVTIEIWATQDAIQGWSRIFAIGSADNNKLTMGWSYGTDINTDFIQLKISGSDLVYQRDTMQPYTLGTKYHISMVIVPNGDGKSTLSWAKRDATTGEVLKSGSSVTSWNWTPGDFASRNLWLGHGYSNNDASATYDEVRVWHYALSAEELTANAQLGPDRIVAYPRCGTIEVASGATLATPADGSVECARLTGAGTLAASSVLVADTLDIAGNGIGTITVDGSLKVVGDWLFDCGANGTSDRIVGTGGTLDLSKANPVPRLTADAYGSWLMATGVTVYDYDQMAVPRILRIRYTDGNLHLIRPGFAIIVR